MDMCIAQQLDINTTAQLFKNTKPNKHWLYSVTIIVLFRTRFYHYIIICKKRKGFGKLPSKHVGSDPEAFWLWSVMAITTSVQPESGWIVYVGSDFPHLIQFHFSKEGMDRVVQTDQDLIWCPRSDLVLADCVRFWPKWPGLEARWCARAVWPASGQRFWADPDWMQIGSDMFAGRLSFCPLLGGSRSGSTKRQVKRSKITFQSTVGKRFGFHWSWSACTSACMYLSFHAKCWISCLF